MAVGWIKPDSPNVVETATSGNKVDCLAVRRKPRFVVPLLAIRDSDPGPTRSGYYVESRFDLRRPPYRFEDNPFAIRRVHQLVIGIVGRPEVDVLRGCTRMRCGSNSHVPHRI